MRTDFCGQPSYSSIDCRAFLSSFISEVKHFSSQRKKMLMQMENPIEIVKL